MVSPSVHDAQCCEHAVGELAGSCCIAEVRTGSQQPTAHANQHGITTRCVNSALHAFGQAVIGAGAAGLISARELLREGHEVRWRSSMQSKCTVILLLTCLNTRACCACADCLLENRRVLHCNQECTLVTVVCTKHGCRWWSLSSALQWAGCGCLMIKWIVMSLERTDLVHASTRACTAS